MGRAQTLSDTAAVGLRSLSSPCQVVISSVVVIAILPVPSCPVSILNTINLLWHAVYRRPWSLSFHFIK